MMQYWGKYSTSCTIAAKPHLQLARCKV